MAIKLVVTVWNRLLIYILRNVWPAMLGSRTERVSVMGHEWQKKILIATFESWDEQNVPSDKHPAVVLSFIRTRQFLTQWSRLCSQRGLLFGWRQMRVSNVEHCESGIIYVTKRQIANSPAKASLHTEHCGWRRFANRGGNPKQWLDRPSVHSAT